MMHNILMVDDDIGNLDCMKMLLQSDNLNIITASSGFEAIELIEERKSYYSLVLIDMHMPTMNGPETAKGILKINPKLTLAAFSCDLTREAVVHAMDAGMKTYIEKCLAPDVIKNKISLLVKEIELASKLDQPLDASMQLVCSESPSMKSVFAKVAPLAASEEKLFISGETGTGKSMLAKLIHDTGPRSQKGKFVSVNCAAIPKELVESQLFGHKKGAFTGAIADAFGFFRQAHGGTLFLDEIGELPLEAQPKLLNAIQNGEITPVGCTSPMKIDVRIISATHRDLSRQVQEGSFRQDLYYRLVVLEVAMPPLRERLEDLPRLIQEFTAKFNDRAKQSGCFARETIEALQAYHWPGNIRELETVVIRHLFNANNGIVRNADLDPSLKQTDAKVYPQLSDLEEKQKRETLRFLQEHLKVARNKAEAAKRMGISASRLCALEKIYSIR